MQAGRLRHRLEIQVFTEVRDDIGGVRYDWLPLTTVWGAVEPLRSKELLEAQKLETRLSHRLTLRYYPGFSQEWRLRLVDTPRIFAPHSLRDIEERHVMLEILAMEIVPSPPRD